MKRRNERRQSTRAQLGGRVSALTVELERSMSAAHALREEILSIATLEQQRIGQELHDATLQELTGLGLLAQNLSEQLARRNDDANAKRASRLAQGIFEAGLRVRSIAHGLVPAPIGAERLPTALAELAASIRETHGLACRYEHSEPARVRDSGTATHLYRIAQEALSNAVRHAKAKDVSIRLGPRNGELLLEIRDDGVGIPRAASATRGVGLRLMEHRCAVIGGRFAIESRQGRGTVVSCALPAAAGAPHE